MNFLKDHITLDQKRYQIIFGVWFFCLAVNIIIVPFTKSSLGFVLVYEVSALFAALATQFFLYGVFWIQLVSPLCPRKILKLSMALFRFFFLLGTAMGVLGVFSTGMITATPSVAAYLSIIHFEQKNKFTIECKL